MGFLFISRAARAARFVLYQIGSVLGQRKAARVGFCINRQCLFAARRRARGQRSRRGSWAAALGMPSVLQAASEIA